MRRERRSARRSVSRREPLTRDQVLGWLRQEGYSILRFEGTGNEEVRLKGRCLVCGPCGKGTNPCYVNLEKQTYYCHKCGAGGHMATLMRPAGAPMRSMLYSVGGGKRAEESEPPQQIDPRGVERWHRDLMANEDVLNKFMKFRCLTLDAIKQAKIGLKGIRGRVVEISVPYIRGGIPRYAKIFSWSDGKKKVYRLPKGSESFPYMLDDLDMTKPVVVTEGELDALVLRSAGLENVCSTPDGSSTKKHDWLDYLEPAVEVVLAYDADEPGQRGMLGYEDEDGEFHQGLVDVLGRQRCRVVEWPTVDGEQGKDPTDYARQGEIGVAIQAIERARRVEDESILVGEAIGEVARDLFSRRGEMGGIKTGFSKLDSMLGGGLRPGEVILVTGFSGEGKSSFCENLMLSVALGGTPAMIASFELSVEETIERLTQAVGGKWFNSPTDEEGHPMYRHSEVLNDQEGEDAIRVLESTNLSIVNHFGRMELSEFIRLVEYGARRLGVRVVLLDHVQYMLDDDADKGEIGEFMREVTLLSRRAAVTVICVSHQVKPGGDSPRATGYGMYGSMRLKGDAHFVLVVSQGGETDQHENLTNLARGRSPALIEVDKHRHLNGSSGSIKMIFEEKAHRFFEVGKESPIATRVAAFNRRARAQETIDENELSGPEEGEEGDGPDLDDEATGDDDFVVEGGGGEED